MMAVGRGIPRTLEQLRSAGPGGAITLQVDDSKEAVVEKTYREAIAALDQFQFWRAGKTSDYRPKTKGLWLPQRRAVAFAHGYLATRRHDPSDEAALIKMPTGTGKTCVIAVLACTSPLVTKTLVLTPRA